MKRPIFLVPPRAILLLLLIGIGVGLPLALAGTWLLPVAVTLVAKDWAAVRDIPTEMHIFPEIPTWVVPQSILFAIVNYGRILLGLAGGCIGLVVGINLWRYLIVTKFRWMAKEQVDAYLKRIAEKG